MKPQKNMTTDLKSILSPYQNQIETLIKQKVSILGPKNALRDACEYALTNGGKRFRPALIFMIAKALGKKADVSEAALAVEFFHTASLVADDLPCMDDDDERREKPSVHKRYDEATALLVSYALIAAGYECIAKNASLGADKNQICLLALENATYNTGLLGATGGQYLDIFPPNLTLSTLREVIHKKTVSLFEISFVFGWLFGGGDPSKLPLVKKAAAHFGYAFQFADDLGDVAQDAENGRKVNVAGVFGIEAAIKMFHEETQQFFETLKKLQFDVPELRAIADLLVKQVSLSPIKK